MRKVNKMETLKPNATLAQKIEYFRTNKGMSQTELGEVLGVNKVAISHYESEERVPDIYALKKLAKLFEVSTDYLLGLSEFENINHDYKIINEVTGLSNKAIKVLENINTKVTRNNILPTINYLIEQEDIFLHNEYCEKVENNNIKIEDYSKDYNNWKANNYKPIISIIDNFFNVKINEEETIHITNKGIKKSDEFNDLYEMFLCTKDIKPSEELVNARYIMDIIKILEDAKKDFLNKNEER